MIVFLGTVLGNCLFLGHFLNFKGGPPAFSIDFQKSIFEFLKANSSIASNRCIKIKTMSIEKDYLPVRYLEDNKTEIFKRFRRIQQFQLTSFNSQNKTVSLSTFRNYINKNRQYKKPTRITDICDYCEW